MSLLKVRRSCNIEDSDLCSMGIGEIDEIRIQGVSGPGVRDGKESNKVLLAVTRVQSQSMPSTSTSGSLLKTEAVSFPSTIQDEAHLPSMQRFARPKSKILSGVAVKLCSRCVGRL